MEKCYLVTKHLDGSTYASFAPDLPDRVGEKFDIGQPDGSTSAGYIVSANSPEDAIWQAAQAQAIAGFLKAHKEGFQYLGSALERLLEAEDLIVTPQGKDAQIAAGRLLSKAGIKSSISDRLLVIRVDGTFAEWIEPAGRHFYDSNWKIEDPFGILQDLEEEDDEQEHTPGTTEP